MTGTIASTLGVATSNMPARPAKTNAHGDTVLKSVKASWICSTVGIGGLLPG